jgi:hypothetical protein
VPENVHTSTMLIGRGMTSRVYRFHPLANIVRANSRTSRLDHRLPPRFECAGGIDRSLWCLQSEPPRVESDLQAAEWKIQSYRRVFPNSRCAAIQRFRATSPSAESNSDSSVTALRQRSSPCVGHIALMFSTAALA